MLLKNKIDKENKKRHHCFLIKSIVQVEVESKFNKLYSRQKRMTTRLKKFVKVLQPHKGNLINLLRLAILRFKSNLNKKDINKRNSL